MAAYTTYKSLEKPLSTEKYNVAVVNKNNDIIDSELHKLDLKNQSQDELLATKEALSAETARATESENANAQRIADETTRAISAEGALRDDLTDLIQTDVSDHDISASSHTDIRNLISELTTKLNTLADSDDTTLDQLSEIIAYIKNNKSLIDGITTSKVNVSDIIDNLTSTDTNKPLSAKQGKVLKDLLTDLAGTVPTKTSQLTNDSGFKTTDTNTWKANTAASEGYVAKGSGQANKVWKTDANGNPGWREESAGGTALSFTPIQQGGGTGQTNNKVYIGWSNGSGLKAQVDSTDMGSIITTGAANGITLPVNKGGTGQTTAVNAANALLNAVPMRVATAPTGNDYIIVQGGNGTDSNVTSDPRRLPLGTVYSQYIARSMADYGTARYATQLAKERYIDGAKFDGRDNISHLIFNVSVDSGVKTTHMGKYCDKYEITLPDLVNNGNSDHFRVENGSKIYLVFNRSLPLGNYVLRVPNALNHIGNAYQLGHNFDSFVANTIYGFMFYDNKWNRLDEDFEHSTRVQSYSGSTGTTKETFQFGWNTNDERTIPSGCYLVVGAAGLIANANCDYFTVHALFHKKNTGKLVALGTNGSTARYSLSVGKGGFGLNNVGISVNANVIYEISIHRLNTFV